MPYKVVMLRKTCIKGFPKQQVALFAKDSVADAVSDLIKNRKRRTELVWYGVGEKHTFGLCADYDEADEVVELRVFDQNKGMGRRANSLWGYNTSQAWISSMYKKFPGLIGKVNHIGSTEHLMRGLSPLQLEKIRDHLAGRVKFRTPLVCSTWAHLLGYPTTVEDYFNRAKILLGEITRVHDFIKRIDLDMGRGKPLFRKFTDIAFY